MTCPYPKYEGPARNVSVNGPNRIVQILHEIETQQRFEGMCSPGELTARGIQQLGGNREAVSMRLENTSRQGTMTIQDVNDNSVRLQFK